MTKKRRKRHTPEQIVKKLRAADAMLNSGKEFAAVLQALETSESTYQRWRNQYGGMKASEANGLRSLRMRIASSKKSLPTSNLTSKCLSTCKRETGKP